MTVLLLGISLLLALKMLKAFRVRRFLYPHCKPVILNFCSPGILDNAGKQVGFSLLGNAVAKDVGKSSTMYKTIPTTVETYSGQKINSDKTEKLQ